MVNKPPHIANRMADIEPFHVMDLLARARALEAQGKDIVHMEIGEPDFPIQDGFLTTFFEPRRCVSKLQGGRLRLGRPGNFDPKGIEKEISFFVLAQNFRPSPVFCFYEMEKRKGFGKKREMLSGFFSP